MPILANIEVVYEFRERPACLQLKLDFVQVMVTAMPFSDIVSQGHRSAADLTTKFVLFGIRKPPGYRVHSLSEIAGLFVNLQIFKGPKRLFVFSAYFHLLTFHLLTFQLF